MAREDNEPIPWWIHLPGAPVDSLESLKRFKVPPEFVHCCFKPDGRKMAGCPRYDICDLPFKDKGDGTARPQNGGVEIIKPTSSGVRSRREVMDCFTYNLARAALEDNGGYVEWIAYEGDKFSPDGTKPVEGKDHMSRPIVTHKRMTEAEAEIVIPPFQTLETRPECVEALRLERRRAEWMEREAKRSRARSYGLTEDEIRNAEEDQAQEGEPVGAPQGGAQPTALRDPIAAPGHKPPKPRQPQGGARPGTASKGAS